MHKVSRFTGEHINFYVFSYSDIDECALGVPYCTAHATCYNTIGSYKCRCKEGFSGVVNDCEGENLGCSDCVKVLWM